MFYIKPYLFVIFSILIIIVEYSKDKDKRTLVSGAVLMMTLLLAFIASYMNNMFVFAPSILINIVNVHFLLKRNENRINESKTKKV
jgi:hypothetical protein